MHKKNIKELVDNLEKGNLTDLEKSKLMLWLFHFEKDRDIEVTDEQIAHMQETVWDRLQKSEPPIEKKILWTKWAVAASILVLFVAGMLAYFIKSEKLDVEGIPHEQYVVLTLSNGEQVNIDKKQAAQIISEGGVEVTIDKDGMILYQLSKNPEEKIGMHEISTGRENIKVKLEDGSMVVLNAHSSLSYPNRFTNQNNREVKLKGEGYFEIQRSPNSPFIVLSNNQKVEVLGTKFNVNAYSPKTTVTSLTEGKIKISNGKHSKILYPGEEAYNDGDNLEIKVTNSEHVLSWMDTNFVFSGVKIEAVMNQLETWYDVDISYDKNIGGLFYANISKNKSIDEVLRILSQTNGVKYKIEGRSIKVTE